MRFNWESTLRLFKEWIENGIPFSVARFNDGELECAQGRSGQNCDGHPYSNELAFKLMEAMHVFFENNVFIPNPIQGTAEEILRDPFHPVSHYYFIADMRAFLETYIKRYPNYLGFMDHRGLHHRSGHLIPQLRDFVVALQKSNKFKIYIGPKRMSGILEFLDIDHFIEIPEHNAFSEYDYILNKSKDTSNGDCIFVITAGMMAKPIIADMILYNKNNTYLDFGSSFDPLFYGQTRTGQPTKEEMEEFYEIT